MVSKISKSELEAMEKAGLVVVERPAQPTPPVVQQPEIQIDLSEVAKANQLLADSMKGMNDQQIAATQQLMSNMLTTLENMKPQRPWTHIELAITERDRNDYIKKASIHRVE